MLSNSPAIIITFWGCLFSMVLGSFRTFESAKPSMITYGFFLTLSSLFICSVRKIYESYDLITPFFILIGSAHSPVRFSPARMLGTSVTIAVVRILFILLAAIKAKDNSPRMMSQITIPSLCVFAHRKIYRNACIMTKRRFILRFFICGI